MTQEHRSEERLHLFGPNELNETQKLLYNRLMAEQVPWAKESGFQAATVDGKLLGPFNALLYSPETGGANMDLFAAENRSTSLSRPIHEIVILTVGAVWHSAYELYAHAAVAQGAGLTEPAIADLVAGRRPSGLSEAEGAAYEFTRDLTKDHRVAADTYGRALAAFGERGVVDIVLLAGVYLTICALLNAFEVAVPEAPEAREHDR